VAPDPIDIAIARAAAPKQRFGGRIQLPSGEVAMIDLPAPMSIADGMALIAVLSQGFSQAPTQTEPPSRIIVPAH
jgi:hypothetical protein